MASRSDVKKAAEAELALKISGRPNKYTRWYGLNDEWCAMFVCYVCNQAGVATSIVPKTASVQALYDFARNNRRFKAKNSGYIPKSGDIMIQKSNGASHTGIVISSSDGTFTTIEGNSGNAVKKCIYALLSSSLTGFFVPDYSENDNGFKEETKTTSNEDVELCSSSIVSRVNNSGEINKSQYLNPLSTGDKYELHIINSGIDYVPIVIGDVKWYTEWADCPGKLKFSILKDSNINITEGNVVIFKTSEYNVFYGYLFEKSKDKEGVINCVAYDQLRYFKNKDTYCYKNKTYSEVLKMIANDYNLICSSSMADTKYIIKQRIEDNVSLFEILKNARTLTLGYSGGFFVLYDDFGSLTLKSFKDLITDYWLNEKTAENFTFKTSIDNEVYNRIQFYRDNKDTGNREKFIYESGSSINEWGILQNTIKLEENDSLSKIGPDLLYIYNRKKKSFDIKGCFGNGNLRAGASLYISLDVGDVVYDRALFFITKACHIFGEKYSCDISVLDFRGMNDISASNYINKGELNDK